MNTINSRIKQIRQTFCEGNNVEFAKKTKKEPNTTSNWVRDGYSVGRGVASEISSAFSVDLDWILTGEGEMLKEKRDTDTSSDSISIPASVWQVISNQAESLKSKDRQLDTVLESLKVKDKQTTEVIELLKEQIKKWGGVDENYHAAIQAVGE